MKMARYSPKEGSKQLESIELHFTEAEMQKIRKKFGDRFLLDSINENFDILLMKPDGAGYCFSGFVKSGGDHPYRIGMNQHKLGNLVTRIADFGVTPINNFEVVNEGVLITLPSPEERKPLRRINRARTDASGKITNLETPARKLPVASTVVNVETGGRRPASAPPAPVRTLEQVSGISEIVRHELAVPAPAPGVAEPRVVSRFEKTKAAFERELQIIARDYEVDVSFFEGRLVVKAKRTVVEEFDL